MMIDQRMIDYAQLLCTATRNDPRVRLGLGPDHAAKIIDQAKQLASDENRTWITPHDIKTVFKTIYPPETTDLTPIIAKVAATNAGLPDDFESGNQSPLEKMPLTLPAPTLLGNSTGEFAPFERNRNFGSNFSWIIALTCA